MLNEKQGHLAVLAHSMEPYLRGELFRNGIPFHATDDVLQEVYERLLLCERPEELRDPPAFIRRVAFIASESWRRREKHSATLSAMLRAFTPEDSNSAATLETNILATEELARFNATLPTNLLPVFLRVSEGYNIGEVAREMNISPRAVRYRLRKLAALSGYDTNYTTPKLQLGSGTPIYDARRAILVPRNEIIRCVEPKLVVASSAIAERLKRCPEAVHNLHSRQFEQLIAEILEDWGWQVHLTPATRDKGIDILACMDSEVGKLLWLVEAKRYSPDHKVGFGMVQRLYGAFASHGATHGMLVTTSTFTAPARELQSKHHYQLTLREYADVVKWIRNYGG
jgi:DNA-directed RNA polymerase specialized sigma24 family protein